MEDPAVTDIGTRLREAREQRQLSLAEIASRTKISIHALEAIEDNDFERLPRGLFRRAFIKTFAGEVGLDGDALADEYREACEIDRAAVAMAEAAAAKNDLPWRRWTITAAACLGVVLCVWLAMTTILRPGHVEVPPVAETPAIESVPIKALGPAAPAGSVQPSYAAAPAPSPPGALPLRLEIRVERPCWVSATADGTRLLYRSLMPGESHLIEAREAIDLRLGDAGALVFTINGAPGRPLGLSGEVVSVRVTTGNAHTLRADALEALRRRG